MQKQKAMKLLDAFTKQSPNGVFIAVVMGAMSGVSYSLLIPTIMTAVEFSQNSIGGNSTELYKFLSIEIANHKFAALFLFLCVFILITRTYSQIKLTRISMDVTYELRKKIYRQISDAPIAAVEKLGPSKLISMLTADVPRIVGGAQLIPNLIIDSITVVGMLFFLYYLNENIFYYVISTLFIGAVAYQIPTLLGQKLLTRSRENFDNLQEAIRGLIYGAKELKLNQKKRREFYREALVKTEDCILKDDKLGRTIIGSANNFGDLLSFFVIGAVGFVFVNYHSISAGELAGTIMALLYLTTPVAILLYSVPQIMIAKISLNKISRIFAEIPNEGSNDEVQHVNDWQILSANALTYQYEPKDETAGFKVGPLDFTINKGEVTFIVGGNGSGKSTLGKLLSLHYTPTTGNIVFGETEVSLENVTSFREEISAIYSDYYLFDKIFGVKNEEMKQRTDLLLEQLELSDVVTFHDGKFSTLSLSDGQRRRLALIVAILEDRDVYIFDEWAADQDPAFKRAFYNTVIPQLKEKGKCIIAITHDDRFFSVADKIIYMEEGQITPLPPQAQSSDSETRSSL